jgi:hypothetical protein
MSHERLAALMQAHWGAIEADPQARVTYETIVNILSALDRGDVTKAQALRLLRHQAQRLAAEPAKSALYRQAASDLRQIPREEH